MDFLAAKMRQAATKVEAVNFCKSFPLSASLLQTTEWYEHFAEGRLSAQLMLSHPPPLQCFCLYGKIRCNGSHLRKLLLPISFWNATQFDISTSQISGASLQLFRCHNKQCKIGIICQGLSKVDSLEKGQSLHWTMLFLLPRSSPGGS